MDAFLINSSSADYKNQIRNSGKMNGRHFISQPSASENFSPLNFHGGLLYTPPFSLSYSSYSPSVSLLNPPQHRIQQQNQPPLLPLPIPYKPYNNNYRKNNNKTKHQSLSLKKPNPSTAIPKKEILRHQSAKVSPESMKIVSSNRLGPNPKDLPKDISRVWSSSPPSSGSFNNDQVVQFSGSVMSTVLSPPPSSLPLPKFSLRPKLSCNAEAAAATDAGATDSLRRILRLP